MKKSIVFFTFLCLAAGNPEMSYAKIDTQKLEYSIPYIPVEKRSTILPKHNICSITPAGESSDNFITGNGTLHMQAALWIGVSISIPTTVRYRGGR